MSTLRKELCLITLLLGKLALLCRHNSVFNKRMLTNKLHTDSKFDINFSTHFYRWSSFWYLFLLGQYSNTHTQTHEIVKTESETLYHVSDDEYYCSYYKINSKWKYWWQLKFQNFIVVAYQYENIIIKTQKIYILKFDKIVPNFIFYISYYNNILEDFKKTLK